MANTNLTDLTLRWEELRDKGQRVTVEDLCQNCPELLEPLRQRVQVLEQMDEALKLAGTLSPSKATSLAQKGGCASVADPEWFIPQVVGYDILKELGRGGMGVVYMARQRNPERIVALKMILPGRQPQPDELARFRREVESLAALQHPNLVTIYEVGEHLGLPYFSLEYVPGGSLEEWIDGRPQPPRVAAELVETLARAIHAAHVHGIIHRDLKPANVLLRFGPAHPTTSEPALLPKITDFGLARRFDTADGPTLSGAIVGTPSFMAPEQAAGLTRQVGPPADIYALGAILYNLLTGRPPFLAETSWETIRQVLSNDVITPRSLQLRIPPDLETICLKCLEKEPSRRYASAAALADDLHSFLVHEPIQARRTGLVGWMRRWARRHPALASVLGVLALALTIIFVGTVVYNVKLQSALDQTETLAEESRQRLVDLYVDRGARQLEDGDHFRALIWFAEALRLDRDRPQAETAHRIRLATTIHGCPRLLQLWTHEGPVRQVKISADGRFVLTAGDDGIAHVWDLATGNAVGQPLVHKGPVVDAAFQPQAAERRGPPTVATASADGTAGLWNVETGERLTPPLVHGKPITSLAFRPDGKQLVTGAFDNTARLWDTKTGKQVGGVLQHDRPVRAVQFSPDGTQVLTASDDVYATIWQVEPRESLPIHKLPHKGAVTCAVFSPDGDLVITGSADATAAIWNTRTGKRVYTLSHRQAVVDVRFSPDGRLAATASDDHTGCIWNLTTGDVVGHALHHRSSLNTVQFSTDSQLVATGSDSNMARVWGPGAGEPLTPLLPHNGGINALAFSPNNKYLATAGNDRVVRLWDLSALAKPSPGLLAPPSGSAPPPPWICPDGTHEAVLVSELAVRVEDVATKAPLGPELRHGSTVRYAAFDPVDDRRLITSSDDNSAYIWDWKSGELRAPPLEHNGSVEYAAFSPDGQFVVTICTDGTARVWDPRTGHPLTPAIPFAGKLESATFDAKGTHLMLRIKGKPVLSWDLRPAAGRVDLLVDLAQLLSANRIGPNFGIRPVDVDQLLPAWRTLRPRYLAEVAGQR
jgi:WD40 repeat protein